MDVIIGILIPFLGTTLGALFVYLLKNEMNKKLEKVLLGFAAGVMIAASVWSLIIPAIEMASESGSIAFLPAAIGFILGIVFLILLDKFTDHMNKKRKGNKLNKATLLVLAVTIHNFPEGMAVGVIFAGFLAGTPGITYAGALALAIGIALQNLPEGAIVSMPLKSDKVSKTKAFLIGMLSGIVEPIGAGLTILLTSFIIPILPYLLSFAAGAMIYVVTRELIPEAEEGKKSYLGVLGVMIGFVIMMVLDVALG